MEPMMKAIALAAAAALSVTGAAAAQSPGYGSSFGSGFDYARFDARLGDDPARKLALCDATRFLVTDPDLDADRIYVQRDSQRRFDLLLPPDFVTGPHWYDEDLERAYRRLRRDGAVSYDQVRAARSVLGRDMVRAFETPTGEQRSFLRQQSRFCETVEDFGRG
jgi:hypothetical protein